MSAQAAQMRNVFSGDEGDRALAEALFDALREATGDGAPTTPRRGWWQRTFGG